MTIADPTQESSVWRERLALDYTPSDYQCGIFDFVESGRGHGVVEAVAGSGKTTTIVSAARLISGRGLFLAFNKVIASMLADKLAGTSMEAKTIHGQGYLAIANACGGYRNVKVEAMKYREALRAYATEARERGTLAGDDLSKAEIVAIDDEGFPVSACSKLLDLARLELIDAYGDNFGAKILGLASHHSIDIEPDLGQLVIDVVRLLMQWGADNPRIIDFTDMVWLPTVLNLRPTKFAWVFVDECQDISKAHLALIRRSLLPGGRALFVGDPCQPEGTVVSTPDGPRMIEDLREGDMVVSCDVRSSAFIQKGKRITGITRKPYKDDLVVADAGDRKSRYTLNHRCVVRFSGFRGKWCVYMQQRGTQYRVGKAAMDYGHSSGPVSRARAEGADAFWILDVFDTEGGAYEAEAMVSAVYGIPQLRFVDGFDSSVLPQDALDRIWDEVGSNQPFAAAALRRFGRSQRWPLFDFSSTDHSLSGGSSMSLKRPIIVRACNLIDGVEMLRYDGRAHYRATQWTPVKISRQHYHGFVYSMDVEKYELYVADGLLTHNCQAIYGFAGADARSFASIIERTESTVLPLSVCYRCPTSVIDLAKTITPQIEARPGAPAGVVRSAKVDGFIDEAREGDMVLCRLNAPLTSLAFKLIAAGVSATVRGKDIGKGLVKVVKMCAKHSGFEHFGLALDSWEEREVDGLSKRIKDEDTLAMRVEAVRDQADCIRIIWTSSRAKSSGELSDAIEGLFGDEKASVVLSSVHRAKGLEADRVFIAKPERLGVAWPNSQPWMVEQEKNLEYVAYTRAKRELVFLDGGDPSVVGDDDAGDPSPATNVDGPSQAEMERSIMDQARSLPVQRLPLPAVEDDAPDVYDPRDQAARVTLARRLDAALRAEGFSATMAGCETVYARDERAGATCKVYSTIEGESVREVGADSIKVALVRGGKGIGKGRRVNRVGKIEAIVSRVLDRVDALTR